MIDDTLFGQRTPGRQSTNTRQIHTPKGNIFGDEGLNIALLCKTKTKQQQKAIVKIF